MTENDIIEQFREMSEDEQAKLLRNLDKYPASISVVEGFVMVGEHHQDKIGIEPMQLEPIEKSDESS